ncbi:hypothetical protein COCC4DRAFT_32080 [Bipolaris maydis ATCC 48331]|uniref:Uncharacterized protein n=2 Tax=Cochliobolus heterostrophus TaxID=5016 RepID=M2TPY8_COCH5|nr:uncharacterized protein COCC4DRAFT_32080 [Bipolaris maydis ATCC 48331]EMD88629.1 hypothetical protein COCHEDRAFT_1022947 [Bipolaris maydis C5]ENI05655.1 hypothetical protein COCC4DRAFT_32080 [Bipolaris maydis ATCC 48331]
MPAYLLKQVRACVFKKTYPSSLQAIKNGNFIQEKSEWTSEASHTGGWVGYLEAYIHV